MCLSQCCPHLVEAARPVYKGANLRHPSVHSHHRRANHAAVRPVIYVYGEKIDVHGKSWHDWHGNYEQMWQTLAVMSISSNLTRAFMTFALLCGQPRKNAPERRLSTTDLSLGVSSCCHLSTETPLRMIKATAWGLTKGSWPKH